MLTERQILAAYRGAIAVVETRHSAGQISGAERRDQLQAIRQQFDIRPRAEMSLDHHIRASSRIDRYREESRRYRERRKAAASTNA